MSKADDDAFVADMKANPNTLKNRIRYAQLEGGLAWTMAALFVAGYGRLSDLSLGEAEEVLRIPPPPPSIDVHVTAAFLHDVREWLAGDGPEPAAMQRRTNGDRWLASLISDIRR